MQSQISLMSKLGIWLEQVCHTSPADVAPEVGKWVNDRKDVWIRQTAVLQPLHIARNIVETIDLARFFVKLHWLKLP